MKNQKARDPRTREEWQEAVDEAEFYLRLAASVAYGLVEYSGEVNVRRCEEIIARGRAAGVYPAPDAVERVFNRLVRVDAAAGAS